MIHTFFKQFYELLAENRKIRDVEDKKKVEKLLSLG